LFICLTGSIKNQRTEKLFSQMRPDYNKKPTDGQHMPYPFIGLTINKGGGMGLISFC